MYEDPLKESYWVYVLRTGRVSVWILFSVKILQNEHVLLDVFISVIIGIKVFHDCLLYQ